MTSKISYYKLICEDIRRRSWLAVLISTVLFLAMPLYALLRLDAFLANAVSYPGVTPDVVEQVSAFFPGLISGQSSSLTFAVLTVIPVMCALSGFSWLHSREKEDFFHSLPVRRTQWFLCTLISGLLLFLVPYVLCSALVLAAGQGKGILSAELVRTCIYTAAGSIMGFLVLYAVCTAACMLTGKTVTALLAAFIMSVYPFLVFSLPTALQEKFFQSYYYISEDSLWEKLASWMSPLVLYTGLKLRLPGQLSAAFLAAGILSAVLLAAAVLLYRRYPSEAAGNTLAFRSAAPVFKILICIPASLFASLTVQNFTGASGTGWTLGLSLLIVVLLCLAADFICQQDFRRMLRGWKTSLACVLAVTFILCIFRFDLTGYDTWIPKKDDIVSMGFRPESFTRYFDYSGSTPDSHSHPYSCVFTENTGPLYRLARSGIENLEDGITPGLSSSAPENTGDSENYMNTVFSYRLKNGRTVFRQYVTDRSSTLDTLAELCKEEEYRRSLFPIFQFDRSLADSVSVSDIYGMESRLDLTPGQISGLLDALEKDTLQADIRRIAEEEPLGELFIWIPDPYNPEAAVQADKVSLASGPDTYGLFSIGNFYIYPGYRNTLDYLNQCGYTFRTSIDPADVSSVTLSLSSESVRSGAVGKLRSRLSASAEYLSRQSGEDRLTVTSPDDIAVILEYLHPYRTSLFQPEKALPDYANIQYTDNSACEFQVQF